MEVADTVVAPITMNRLGAQYPLIWQPWPADQGVGWDVVAVRDAAPDARGSRS